VKSILFHDCKDCQQHLVNIKPAHPSQYKAEMILQTDATLSLFALLVFLRHPLLIGTFLISFDSKSLPLPRYLSTWDLMDRYFGHLPRKSREQLVATFQQYKWQFSAPTFDDGSFQLYEQGTILPFLDEVPIGSGGYGRVSRVYVHSYYCKIPVASSLVRFNRTQFTTVMVCLHSSRSLAAPLGRWSLRAKRLSVRMLTNLAKRKLRWRRSRR
jgi:hypothetical protein